MSDSCTALSYRRVETIFDECANAGTVYGNGVVTSVNFHDSKIKEHKHEIRDMLAELSTDVHPGNSWRAFMFDSRESQWAGSVIATKLIALGIAAGFILDYSREETRALKVPVSELPWYRTVL